MRSEQRSATDDADNLWTTSRTRQILVFRQVGLDQGTNWKDSKIESKPDRDALSGDNRIRNSIVRPRRINEDKSRSEPYIKHAAVYIQKVYADAFFANTFLFTEKEESA